ncbi:uncharacterized protein I303_108646 [Kwoniella dejecticola CBS 10117]|uniref:Uncharacterized protein n=1 Tax=Kwoniella dejecticola CBS 10117 TaxID=1296121 RepID=A0A1A5ZWU3_9TREE|nr:uncharacterized protein I303_07029 [Kwoniella dejecticola CBS 10117]OBR82270.1 hypothetical protein I303_07029 [Kwoniella dejecticola CBS 10117]
MSSKSPADDKQEKTEWSHWTSLIPPTDQVPSASNGSLPAYRAWYNVAKDVTNATSSRIASAVRPALHQRLSGARKRVYNTRCSEFQGYKPFTCQQLVSKSESELSTSGQGAAYTMESAMDSMKECARPVCLTESKNCAKAGYCAYGLCEEHMCAECQRHCTEVTPVKACSEEQGND